jgi:hypothetical protein
MKVRKFYNGITEVVFLVIEFGRKITNGVKFEVIHLKIDTALSEQFEKSSRKSIPQAHMCDRPL